MDAQSQHDARSNVLIVDDDPGARRQLRELLTANGYAVAEAGNGRIARDLLAARHVNLVLTDIFMPECDGFELIAAVRGMARPVPVIAMSDHESWTGLGFFDAANDLGAAAVIEKPFRAGALLRLVAESLAADPHARVIPIEGWAGQAPRRVPAGLEWLGARPAR
jgi:DNA-binding NtrC family response regulator